MKRLIAWFLTLIMVIGMMPAQVLAEESETVFNPDEYHDICFNLVDEAGNHDERSTTSSFPVVQSNEYAGYSYTYCAYTGITIDEELYYFAEPGVIEADNYGTIALTKDAACSGNLVELFGNSYEISAAFFLTYEEGDFVFSWEPIYHLSINGFDMGFVGVDTQMGSWGVLDLEEEQPVTIQYDGAEWGIKAGNEFFIGSHYLGKLSEGASPVVLPAGKYYIGAEKFYPSEELWVTFITSKVYGVRDDAGNPVGMIQPDYENNFQRVIMKGNFAPGTYETYYTEPYVSEGESGYRSETVDSFEITEPGEYWVIAMGYTPYDKEADAVLYVVGENNIIPAVNTDVQIDHVNNSACVYSFTAETAGAYNLEFSNITNSLNYCLLYSDGSIKWNSLYIGDPQTNTVWLDEGEQVEICIVPSYYWEDAGYELQVKVTEHEHRNFDNGVCVECGTLFAASVYLYSDNETAYFEALDEALEYAEEKNHNDNVDITVYQSGECLEELSFENAVNFYFCNDTTIHLKKMEHQSGAWYYNGTVIIDDGLLVNCEYEDVSFHGTRMLSDITVENGRIWAGENAVIGGNLRFDNDPVLNLGDKVTMYCDPSQYIHNMDAFYVVQGVDDRGEYWTIQPYLYNLVGTDGDSVAYYDGASMACYAGFVIDHICDTPGNYYYPIRDEVNGFKHTVYFSQDASERLGNIQLYDVNYVQLNLKNGLPVFEYSDVFFYQYSWMGADSWNEWGIDMDPSTIYGTEELRFKYADVIYVPVDENGNVVSEISNLGGNYLLTPFDEAAMDSEWVTFDYGPYDVGVTYEEDHFILSAIKQIYWGLYYQSVDGFSSGYYDNNWSNLRFDYSAQISRFDIEGIEYYPTSDITAEQGAVQLSREDLGYRITIPYDESVGATRYIPQVTVKNGIVTFEWEKEPHIYCLGRPWTLATDYDVNLTEETECIVEWDGKLYGISEGEFIRYNTMYLKEYEEGSEDIGAFTMPAGEYRILFDYDMNTLRMDIRNKIIYQLYDQNDTYVATLNAYGDNMLKRLVSGTYSVKAAITTDEGTIQWKTIISDIEITETADYTLRLEDVDDYRVGEEAGVQVQQKHTFTADDVVTIFVDKYSESPEYFFEPEQVYYGILHITTNQDIQYYVKDTKNYYAPGYLISGTADVKFSLNYGEALSVYFRTTSMPGTGTEETEISFWIEEDTTWNCEAHSEWGNDYWNSERGPSELGTNYTLSSININGTPYYPAMSVSAESGSVLMQEISNGYEITIRGQYSDVMPVTARWMTKEQEGYVFHWEKIYPASIDGQLIPWYQMTYLDVNETRSFTVNWNGEEYGIMRGDEQGIGYYDLSLVKMTEENAIPITLNPEKYSVSLNVGNEHQLGIHIGYTYKYYLKNDDTGRFGDIETESGLGNQIVAPGTYELWAVKAEKLQGPNFNTGKTIVVPDDGNQYMLYLGHEALMHIENGSPSLVRVQKVESGRTYTGNLDSQAALSVYEYTAEEDTPVSFELTLMNMAAFVTIVQDGEHRTEQIGGWQTFGALLKKGESIRVFLAPSWMSSMGNFQMKVSAGCDHIDENHDGSCDICKKALAVEIMNRGYSTLYESFDEAMEVCSWMAYNQDVCIRLLGKNNEYVYDGQIVFYYCDNINIELNGNTLTVTDGIHVYNSAINVYGAFDVSYDNSILNADIDIVKSSGGNAEDVYLRNMTYFGTINLTNRADDYLYLMLSDGVFNGDIIARSDTSVMLDTGAIVNAEVMGSNAIINFMDGAVIHGEVSCLDEENTNMYYFDKALFSYRPDSLIDPAYQVIIEYHAGNGEIYYQPSNMIYSDEDIIDPSLLPVLDQLIDEKMLFAHYVDPEIISNDAEGLSWSMEKDGSYNAAVRAIYDSRIVSLRVALDRLLREIDGYDYDHREDKITADLRGGYAEVFSRLKINEHSVLNENNGAEYFFDSSIETIVNYYDANYNRIVLVWNEPIVDLHDYVTLKLQAPSEINMEKGVVEGIYRDDTLCSVNMSFVNEEDDKLVSVIDGWVFTGSYLIQGTGEPVKVWSDDTRNFEIPSEVEFDYVGQCIAFDATIQPVLDGTMDGDAVNIVAFPCSDVLEFGAEDNEIVAAKVGNGSLILTALKDNKLIAWTAIDATVERKTAQIEGCSLTLDGRIGLNFYLDIPTSVLETLGEGAYVELRRGFTTEQHIPLSEARRAGELFKFTTYVSAKEMHDQITLWLYDGEGKPYVFYGRDGEICVKGYRFSVADYCERVWEMADSMELMDLATDLLSYGNLAQQYFGYKPETIDFLNDYPNAGLDEFAYELRSDFDTVRYWGSSLLLKDGTVLRHYFRFDEDVQNYQVTVDGNPVELIQKGETYYLDVDNIAAQDLDEMYNVSITKKDSPEDGALTLCYGPFSYARSAMKKGNDIKNLMMSLYHYYRAAEAYFNQ